MNDDNDDHVATSFAGDMLDLDKESRQLRLEPIYDKDSVDRGQPLIRGFAMHQHSEVPVVTMDGVEVQGRCDYIVLDTAQIKQIATMFSMMDLTIRDKDGNPLD